VAALHFKKMHIFLQAGADLLRDRQGSWHPPSFRYILY